MSIHGNIFFIGGRGGIGAEEGFAGSPTRLEAWQPAADILEIEGGFLVQVDLPGVEASSIEAVIDRQMLLLKGVRRAICPTRGKRYIHMEVARGMFSKAIHLPEPVEQDNASAVLRDGVLEIFLPLGKRTFYSITTLRITSSR